MVMSNHSWENETRKYLTETQSELAVIDEKLKELRAKRDSVAREVEAYEIALQSYLKRTGRQDVTSTKMREVLTRQPNHQERLKRLAEGANGVVKVGQATDILYNFRLMKAKSRANAYRIVYGLLSDMTENGEFAKIAPSTFRLNSSQQSLLSQANKIG